MVDFAIEMLSKLQKFNKDALQELKLRIGIAVGPVIAGRLPSCNLFLIKNLYNKLYINILYFFSSVCRCCRRK